MSDWLTWKPSIDPSQVNERVATELHGLREKADRSIFWLVIVQWSVMLVGNFLVASQSTQSSFDSLSSLVIGVGIFSFLPLFGVIYFAGQWQARWSVLISQGLMSTLLWSFCSDRPETHFHLFAWLVVMTLYRDIAALPALSAVAFAGHAVVYAARMISGGMPIEFEHSFMQGIWCIGLVAEAAVLQMFVLHDRQMMAMRAKSEIDLESMRTEFQQAYDAQSKQLTRERDLLQTEVATLNASRIGIESARNEAVLEMTAMRREFAEHGNAIIRLASRPVDTSLSKTWRTHWASVRKEAQKLIRLIDLPSLNSIATLQKRKIRDTYLREESHSAEALTTMTRRALVMVRNPLQKTKATDALEAEGFTVDIVANGPATYYSAMLNDYSMIVVDVDLPGDEGFDTIEGLRLLPPDRLGKSNCLFAMTNELTQDRILKCTEAGIDGIFMKPLDSKAIHRTLSGKTSIKTDEGSKSKWGWTGVALFR